MFVTVNKAQKTSGASGTLQNEEQSKGSGSQIKPLIISLQFLCHASIQTC
jgi:hypothetical protein